MAFSVFSAALFKVYTRLSCVCVLLPWTFFFIVSLTIINPIFFLLSQFIKFITTEKTFFFLHIKQYFLLLFFVYTIPKHYHEHWIKLNHAFESMHYMIFSVERVAKYPKCRAKISWSSKKCMLGSQITVWIVKHFK